MFSLGIDVAKQSHRYLLLNPEGKKIRSSSFENSSQGFQSLWQQLQDLKIPPQDLLIGMEATGCFWENLYSFLKEKGFPTVLLNPFHVKKFREALGKKAKTDEIDALVIAQFLRTQGYVQSQVVEENIQSLRQLTRLRFELLNENKNYHRQVCSLLTLIFPEYEQTFLKNPFTATSRAILEKFPTAKKLAQTKPKQIEKIVRSIHGNPFDLQEITALLTAAKNSIYSGRAEEARSTSLRILLTQVASLLAAIQKLEEEIHKILSPQKSEENGPGENLLTIPGVGEKTQAATLSYLGEKGTNFSSSTDAVGYIGFFPKIHQSGQTQKENKICKRGPKVFRWALYMAAVASVKHNPEMKILYQQKCAQGKTKKQALICVGKKLLQIMLAMLKSGKPYNPQLVFKQA